MTFDLAETTAVGNAMPIEHQAEHILIDREETHLAAVMRLSECRMALLSAANLVTTVLADGNSVFVVGNGGSAAEAQHFAAELVGRFRRERRAFPVLALTTDSSILTAVANDYCFDDIFARQLEAFARPGDVLVAFSTSGESENVIRAAHTARLRGASVVGMTGERECRLGQCADILVQAPSTDTPTIQELHSMFTHGLCDVVESALTLQEGASPV